MNINSSGCTKTERTLRMQVEQLKIKTTQIEDILFPNRSSTRESAPEGIPEISMESSEIESEITEVNIHLQIIYDQL